MIINMNQAISNFGSVIRVVRTNLDMSLDEAAKITGVSKAMLGQIERNESNPTVSTLWKISNGLRIPFSRLLNDATPPYEVTGLDELPPIYEDDGNMILYNLFPFDPISGFDYFFIQLLPGCRYISQSHPTVKTEYIVVTEGCLELTVGTKVFQLQKGTSIKFQGASDHIYANPSDTKCEFQNIMQY